jgi:hypothetical protein
VVVGVGEGGVYGGGGVCMSVVGWGGVSGRPQRIFAWWGVGS